MCAGHSEVAILKVASDPHLSAVIESVLSSRCWSDMLQKWTIEANNSTARYVSHDGLKQQQTIIVKVKAVTTVLGHSANPTNITKRYRS